MKNGKIFFYPKNTRVRINSSVKCDPSFHVGGLLVFQDSKNVERGEYRVGIRTNKGICFEFHPDFYEIIDN